MKEKFVVIDADYRIEDNKTVVLLYCKDEDGKTVLATDKNFNPYFYVLPRSDAKKLKSKIESEDFSKDGFEITSVEIVERILQDTKREVLKVFVDIPGNVPKARSEIKNFENVEETFEFDIPFYKRYLIDKQILPTGWVEVEGEKFKPEKKFQVDYGFEIKSINPIESDKKTNFNVLVFDTEFVEENNESKLVMLSIFDKKGFKTVITSHDWKGKQNFVKVVPDEGSIIKEFLKIVKERDPDFICAYNSDNFDFPKIEERADKYKISLKLGRDQESIRLVRRGIVSSARTKGRVHIDLYDFVSNILRPSMKSEVLTLNEVAQEILGLRKKEMKYKDMVEIWNKKEDMGRLAEYSLWDSELTLKLADRLLPQIFALAKITGQLPFDVSRYLYSQLVESFYMKKAFVDDTLIPNRPLSSEIEERRAIPQYKGAIVIEPKKGIHSNILVFDFRSLYPTIIVSHNIDPFTFMCGHAECRRVNQVPETKFHFCKKEKGFIPRHLEELIVLRKQTKDRMKKLKKDSDEYRQLDNMQFALKTLTNATYGSLAYAGARWYRRECGSATTGFGRFYITKVIEIARKEGFEIIYGDTDSLMATFSKEKSVAELRSIGEGFAEKINKTLPGIIELEFRDLYEGGIFVARREGEVGAKKRYALIGFDGKLEIRGFETVRRDWCELAKKIQRDVLLTILKDKDPVKAVKLVREVIEKIRSGKVPLEDLTIYEMLTRPLSHYAQIGPHVKAAQKLKERGWIVGEGVVIAFVITKGSGSISDRAEPVEFVKPGQYDPEYYINNQILPASMRVLRALGYESDEVLFGKVQKKLEGFFKKR